MDQYATLGELSEVFYCQMQAFVDDLRAAEIARSR
jgi:hypothetical protein